MLNVSSNFLQKQSASVREVESKVELYSGSTLLRTFTENDNIVSFEIQRNGDNSKVFGYSITQCFSLVLLDKDRELTIQKGQKLKPYLGFDNEFVTYPFFIVNDVKRDENNNQLTITAYDLIYTATKDKFSSLHLTNPTYTLNDIIFHIAAYYQTTAIVTTSISTALNTRVSLDIFPADVTIRQVINYIAEATQTIVYIDASNRLWFKRLKSSDSSLTTVNKANYSKLSSQDNITLYQICAVNEDSEITATLSGYYSGTTQYIRDNPILKSITNLQAYLERELNDIGALTINQYNLEWFGNVALEIGDRISITTKDDNTIQTNIINDTIKFNGGLFENSSWEFIADGETASQTVNIVDAIRHNSSKEARAAVLEATSKINGTNGGYIKILDLDGDGNPDNIFVADVDFTANQIVPYEHDGIIEYVLDSTVGATSVLRINNSGIGVSSGVNAGTASNPYTSSMTGEGINADTINAGTLRSLDGNAYFDLTNGVFKSGSNIYFLIDGAGSARWYMDNNEIGRIVPLSSGSPHTPANTSLGIVYNTNASSNLSLGSVTTTSPFSNKYDIFCNIGKGTNEVGGQVEVRGTNFSGLIYRRDFDAKGTNYYVKTGVGSVTGDQEHMDFNSITLYSTKNTPTSSQSKPSGVTTNEFYGVTTPDSNTFYPLTKLMNRSDSIIGYRFKGTMGSYGWQKLVFRCYGEDDVFLEDIEITDWCKTTTMTFDKTFELPYGCIKYRVGIKPDTGNSEYWGGWKDVSYYRIYRNASASLELVDGENVLARIDVAPPIFEGGVARVRLRSDVGISGWFEITTNNEIIFPNGYALAGRSDGLYYQGLKLAFE